MEVGIGDHAVGTVIRYFATEIEKRDPTAERRGEGPIARTGKGHHTAENGRGGHAAGKGGRDHTVGTGR